MRHITATVRSKQWSETKHTNVKRVRTQVICQCYVDLEDYTAQKRIVGARMRTGTGKTRTHFAHTPAQNFPGWTTGSYKKTQIGFCINWVNLLRFHFTTCFGHSDHHHVSRFTLALYLLSPHSDQCLQILQFLGGRSHVSFMVLIPL
jgi:hypothetical protein